MWTKVIRHYTPRVVVVVEKVAKLSKPRILGRKSILVAYMSHPK
jgi:hypothetical protein